MKGLFLAFVSGEESFYNLIELKMYWEDIVDDNDRWTGLKVIVDDDVRSDFRLESGENYRFKLSCKNQPLLWGTFGEEFWGIWGLVNLDAEAQVLLPVRSSTIEEAKESDFLSFWTRHFVKELIKSKVHFFSTGEWTVLSGDNTNDHLAANQKVLKGTDKLFLRKNPFWKEWEGISAERIVALKKEPDDRNGRVKWFRKLVRETCCPPVLIWSLSCLDGYVILDGHCRLKAFQLEQVPPVFLVVNEVKEQAYSINVAQQQGVLRSLHLRMSRSDKPQLQTDKLNQILIAAFDNRPYRYPVARATVKSDFDRQWTAEVRTFGEENGYSSDQIENMISRTEL